MRNLINHCQRQLWDPDSSPCLQHIMAGNLLFCLRMNETKVTPNCLNFAVTVVGADQFHPEVVSVVYGFTQRDWDNPYRPAPLQCFCVINILFHIDSTKRRSKSMTWTCVYLRLYISDFKIHQRHNDSLPHTHQTPALHLSITSFQSDEVSLDVLSGAPGVIRNTSSFKFHLVQDHIRKNVVIKDCAPWDLRCQPKSSWVPAESIQRKNKPNSCLFSYCVSSVSDVHSATLNTVLTLSVQCDPDTIKCSIVFKSQLSVLLSFPKDTVSCQVRKAWHEQMVGHLNLSFTDG